MTVFIRRYVATRTYVRSISRGEQVRRERYLIIMITVEL